MESSEFHVWGNSDVEEILSEDLLELNLSSFSRASGGLIDQARLDGETKTRALGWGMPATRGCGTVGYQVRAASESYGHVRKRGDKLEGTTKRSPIIQTELKNTGVHDIPEIYQHSLDVSVRPAGLANPTMLVPQSALVQANRGLHNNVLTYAHLPAHTVPASSSNCELCVCRRLRKLFKGRNRQQSTKFSRTSSRAGVSCSDKKVKRSITSVEKCLS